MRVLVADADGTDEIKARPAKLSLSPEAPTFTPRKHKEDCDLVSPTPNQPHYVTKSPKSNATITALNVVELLLEGGLQHVNNELSTVVEMTEDDIGPAIVAGLKGKNIFCVDYEHILTKSQTVFSMSWAVNWKICDSSSLNSKWAALGTVPLN